MALRTALSYVLMASQAPHSLCPRVSSDNLYSGKDLADHSNVRQILGQFYKVIEYKVLLKQRMGAGAGAGRSFPLQGTGIYRTLLLHLSQP